MEINQAECFSKWSSCTPTNQIKRFLEKCAFKNNHLYVSLIIISRYDWENCERAAAPWNSSVFLGIIKIEVQKNLMGVRDRLQKTFSNQNIIRIGLDECCVNWHFVRTSTFIDIDIYIAWPDSLLGELRSALIKIVSNI